MSSADLPRPAPTHPRRAMLHGLRPAFRAAIRRKWRVRLHGVEHVPATGPLILAANHIGWLDGPLLAIFSPRPVHALTKEEMFEGRMGKFLSGAGQIPLDRHGADPSAIKSCLRVLSDGGVIGIFPEGTRGAGDFERFRGGAAYLALASGAPVVPVTMLGTREPGGGNSSRPPDGACVDISYGPTWQVPVQAWPRTREQVRSHSALLREHLRVAQADALSRTGRALPGPLPAGESEYDPSFGSSKKEHHD